MLSAPIQDLLVDRATGPALGRVASPDAEVRWTRISPDGQPLDVYVGYVAYQRGGSRAVSSTSIVVQRDDERWQILSEETVRVGVDEQRQILLRGREPSNEGEWRVRRLYWVDGWFGVSAIEAKWRGLWQLARGRGDAAAMLVLARRDGSDANEVMNAEWERLRAPLNERLLMLSAPPAAGHNLAP
jgi:EpsI family protein